MTEKELTLKALATENRWEILFVAAMTAVSLSTVGQFYLREIGLIDPWLYTALINDYFSLVDRYGATYYASRIGHIWPAAVAEFFFGLQWGALLYKYLMLFCAGAAIYLYGAANFSRSVGLLGSAVVLGSPWLLSQFTGDLYSGVVGVYLLISLAAAFSSVGAKRSLTVVAGIFAGLAVHTYQFVIGIFVFVLPIWIYTRYVEKSDWLRLLQIGAIAFFLTYIFLQGLLYLAHPAWRVMPWNDPSLKMGYALTVGGVAESWWNPLSEADHRIGYLLAPLFVAFGLLILLVKRGQTWSAQRRLSVLSAAGLAILPYGYYLVNHILVKGGALTWDFSASFLFPPALIALMTLISLTSFDCQVRPIRQGSYFIGVALVFFSLIALRPSVSQVFSSIGLIGLIFSGFFCIIFMAYVSRDYGLRFLPFFLFFSAAPFTLYSSDLTHKTAGDGPQDLSSPSIFGGERRATALAGSGWDIKVAIAELAQLVESSAPVGRGKLGFWYDDSFPELDSLQSGFFWGYSRAFVSNGISFPGTGADTEKLWDPLTFLAVLTAVRAGGDSSKLVQRHRDAEIAIRDYAHRNGKRLSVVGRKVIPGVNVSFEAVVFALLPPRAPLVERQGNSLGFVSVADIVVPEYWAPATVVSEGGRGTRITAPRFGYSALMNLRPAETAAQRGRISVWASIDSGALSVTASEFNNVEVVFDKATVGWSDARVFLTLDIPDLSVPITLIFGNPSSVESKVVIHAVEVAKL